MFFVFGLFMLIYWFSWKLMVVVLGLLLIVIVFLVVLLMLWNNFLEKNVELIGGLVVMEKEIMFKLIVFLVIGMFWMR